MGPDTSDTVTRLVQLLRLEPGQREYEVVLVPGEFPARCSPGKHFVDRITVTPRSLVKAAFFMSQGVEVPREHIEQGLVRLTFNPDGSLFDWGQVLDNLFRVYSCKHKPRNAFVAVRYRDYWFYIDERDTASIESILLYNSAARLQALRNVSKSSGSPLLTLPVGP